MQSFFEKLVYLKNTSKFDKFVAFCTDIYENYVRISRMFENGNQYIDDFSGALISTSHYFEETNT